VAHDAIALARERDYNTVDTLGSYRRIIPIGEFYEDSGEIFRNTRTSFLKLTSVRNPKTIPNGVFVNLIRKFRDAGVELEGM